MIFCRNRAWCDAKWIEVADYSVTLLHDISYIKCKQKSKQLIKQFQAVFIDDFRRDVISHCNDIKSRVCYKFPRSTAIRKLNTPQQHRKKLHHALTFADSYWKNIPQKVRWGFGLGRIWGGNDRFLYQQNFFSYLSLKKVENNRKSTYIQVHFENFIRYFTGRVLNFWERIAKLKQ